MTGGSSSNRKALRIALLYLILGAVWIVCSDVLLDYFGPADPYTLTVYQTWKGWVFIFVTAVLLFLLIRESLLRQGDAMERLAISEDRYRNLADLAPVGIYHADAGGMITYVNPTLARLSGLPVEECLGTGWVSAVFAADRRRIQEKWMQCTVNGEEFRDEYRLQHGDGTVIWVIEIGHPRYDDSGVLSGYLGTVLDITLRREEEDRRHELEERLRLAVHAANVGFFDWNLKSSKVFYSPEWKAQIGYQEDEIGDGFDEWINRVHPEDRDRVSRAYRAFLRGTEREYVTDFRFRHRDGTWRWILTRAAKLNDTDGNPEHMLGLHLDVTDLKETELALRESEERLNYLLAANPTVLYVLEVRDGKPYATWVSGNVTRILGYTAAEALADGWWADNLHPDDRERELRTTLAALDEDHMIHEYRFKHKRGGFLWIRDEMRIVRQEHGGKVEIMGSWSDVGERRREEEKMLLYAAAFENSRDGVIITDPDTRIISANRAFEQAVGYSEEELIGETPRLFDSGRHDAEFYRDMWGQLKGVGHWQGELWIRRKNSEVSPHWLTINTVHDDNGRLTHYVAVYSDISKLKQSEEQLEHLAHYDVLTNMPNRLLLDLRLNHAIEQMRRRGGHIGVLFLDLDDFKKVNDSLGHARGDELLVAVSKRLRLRVRGEDTLGRFGGDEFLIVLESLDRPEDAATVARDLLASLQQPFRLSSGHEVYAECSIGISLYPDDGGTTEELLRNADIAMYRAKRNGRNQFQFFTIEMSRNTVMELELETALRQALDRESLILHYQPKVDLHSGRIAGMEALIRWDRGDGLVPPSRFIPIAETTGLIIPIGAWAINRVCRQIREWLNDNLDPQSVAVNVSAAQFRPGNLEDIVRAALDENGLEGSRLELEITESSLMDHPEEIITMMKNLNTMGVRISLDDFGTGFSSLSYLTRFPIEIMKIDGSFVHDMMSDDNARAIVDSIIDLAHGLGMSCVAEMVETVGQADYLVTRGCDQVQGHYFCRDLPAPEITQILREDKSFYKV